VQHSRGAASSASFVVFLVVDLVRRKQSAFSDVDPSRRKIHLKLSHFSFLTPSKNVAKPSCKRKGDDLESRQQACSSKARVRTWRDAALKTETYGGNRSSREVTILSMS
jgi:hypothetical protein